MRLFSLIPLTESDAAEEAHKLGLVASGWGYWSDKSGKKVARTVKGQLVKLESDPSDSSQKGSNSAPDEKSSQKGTDAPSTRVMAQQATEPQENPFNAALPIDQQQAIKDYMATMAAEYQKFQNQAAMIDHARPKTLFSDPPTPEMTEEIRQAWEDTSKGPAGFVTGILDSLNVPHNVKFIPLSSRTKDYEEECGAEPFGFFDPLTQEIHISPDTTKKVDIFFKMTKEALAHSLTAPNGHTNPDYRAAVLAAEGVHTIIHESIHAKDRYLNSSPTNRMSSTWGSRNDKFVIEGLTEWKAKQYTQAVVQHMFGAPLSDQAERHVLRCYTREVKAYEFLEKIKPGTIHEVASKETLSEREAVISNTLENWYTSAFAAREQEWGPEYSEKISKVVDMVTRKRKDWFKIWKRKHRSKALSIILNPEYKLDGPSSLNLLIQSLDKDKKKK